MNQLRADLHMHTLSSPDSANLPADIVNTCLLRGINCIAVTDHNKIQGCLKVREAAPFKVIIAEEITTPMGEIIGLFLEEEIQRGLPPEETARRIRSQGGLVMIPHPFDRLRRSRLSEEALNRLVAVSLVDIIEVFNSRTSLLADQHRARRFAQDHGLLMAAGSDAHTLGEIGHAFVEMPSFEDKEGFLRSLAHGRVIGRRSSPLVHVRSTVTKWRKKR